MIIYVVHLPVLNILGKYKYVKNPGPWVGWVEPPGTPLQNNPVDDIPMN